MFPGFCTSIPMKDYSVYDMHTLKMVKLALRYDCHKMIEKSVSSTKRY